MKWGPPPPSRASQADVSQHGGHWVARPDHWLAADKASDGVGAPFWAGQELARRNHLWVMDTP